MLKISSRFVSTDENFHYIIHFQSSVNPFFKDLELCAKHTCRSMHSLSEYGSQIFFSLKKHEEGRVVFRKVPEETFCN